MNLELEAFAKERLEHLPEFVLAGGPAAFAVISYLSACSQSGPAI